MKIIRLGKNGMVRSQQGTWFIAGFFKSFFIGQQTDALVDDPWIVYGDSGGDFVELGSYAEEKLAQQELDGLFSSHEANDSHPNETHVGGKYASALEKKASEGQKTAKRSKTGVDEHKTSILSSMQDHTDKVWSQAT